MISNIKKSDNLTYLEFKEGDNLYSCVGIILNEDKKSVTLGFNFYLNDPVDVLTLKKKDILKIERAS